MNGHPAAGIAITPAPGTNALEAGGRDQEPRPWHGALLPAGHEAGLSRRQYRVHPAVDPRCRSRPWRKRSPLVILVMFIFLQNWRTTLVPAVAVPVVLLGTFGVLATVGYSINTLTLFALVLVIGLLVDDAIVVVENVERIMREEGLAPARSHLAIDEGNHWRPDRHRPGADGGVPADGVFRRLDRRDLPPILRHHRLGDAAFDHVRPGADAGACAPPCSSRSKAAITSMPAACWAASSAGSMPVLRRTRDWYRHGAGEIPGPHQDRDAGLCRDPGRARRPVRLSANRLSAGRGPRRPDQSASTCRRLDSAGTWRWRRRWRSIISRTKPRMSILLSPSPASAFWASARIPASLSSN